MSTHRELDVMPVLCSAEVVYPLVGVRLFTGNHPSVHQPLQAQILRTNKELHQRGCCLSKSLVGRGWKREQWGFQSVRKGGDEQGDE